MISLNGLMLDGSMIGIVLFVFVILVEILYCAATICVIVIARRLKTNQVRTEQHLAEIEQELKTLNRALMANRKSEKDCET